MDSNFIDLGGGRIYIGDSREVMKILPDKSIQTVCTSPPYLGLRDYGTATWEGGSSECDHMQVMKISLESGLRNDGRKHKGLYEGEKETQSKNMPYKDKCGKCGAIRVDSQIGMEITPEEYVENMVSVFRLVRQKLRDDGTLWLNLGDSYNSTNGFIRNKKGESSWYRDGRENGASDKTKLNQGVIKEKDLMGIPWRVALALQSDGVADHKAIAILDRVMKGLIGEYDKSIPDRVLVVLERLQAEYAEAKGTSWYLRNDIIWSKPNPMPESATDRCTKSHEYIFLLTKSAQYYYDVEAVKEPANYPSDKRRPLGSKGAWELDGREQGENGGGKEYDHDTSTRNLRDVWTITPANFKGAHFATFPPELPAICIKAGTSEKGACSECGSPWERILEKTVGISTSSPKEQLSHEARGGTGRHTGTVGESGGGRIDGYTTTLGWKPTCKYHNDNTVPCTVLDPFAGAGTTLKVAQELGRNYIGIELSEKYAKEITKPRLTGTNVSLGMTID